MNEINVTVHAREETGKNANRRLRAGGEVPAVVYGGGAAAVPIRVERKVLQELLRQEGGEHAVFRLSLEGSGKSRHTMIRDLEIDPITRQIVHVDFQRINLKEKVRVEVSIELEGEPIGVRNDGGVLDFQMREIEIESLPANIPPHLTVNVSDLEIGDHVEDKDLVLPEGIELVGGATGRVLASVSHSRVAADLEEVEAAAEGEELLEAEAEEPEVIGRGDDEDDEEDEEEG